MKIGEVSTGKYKIEVDAYPMAGMLQTPCIALTQVVWGYQIDDGSEESVAIPIEDIDTLIVMLLAAREKLQGGER